VSASATDKFKKVGVAGTATTLSAPGHSISGTTITVGSTTNWPTDTGVTFAIRQVDSSGALVAGTYTEWNGTVSGSTITNMTLVYGTDQVYPAGSTTQVYIPVSAARDNELVDGLLEEHDQDGTHGDITPTSVNTGAITATSITTSALTISGSAFSEVWAAVGDNPDTITYNGNRNYDLVFNSNDLTDTLSPGMKLKLTRTVAAPDQCADLESSSSQYFNKTSPAGMTFTDDFTCSAWIKLESYADCAIVSRYNGTSGWTFRVENTGRVYLQGYNAGAANTSYVRSYASLPLNKWVHVSAQLDMSAFTATTATSYVMFDGLDVPAEVGRGGTNPTALVQAGNLEVGGVNGGTSPFDGKLAQVAIFNAKVTQATMRTYMSQGLSGSETSLISAYSFDNAITDLNTTNANNLTANGGALATNADSPFADAKTAGLQEYAEINAVTFSTNTTVNVRVPDTCMIPTSGGVSASYYAVGAYPYGLPAFSNIIGYTFLGGNFTTANTTRTEINGLRTTVYVPPKRQIKISIYTKSLSGTAADLASFEIHDGAVSSTTNMIQGCDTPVAAGATGPSLYVETVESPNSNSTTALAKTYIASLNNNTAGRNITVNGDATSTFRRPLFIKVELV
jgi:hypothetical protein